MNGRPDQRRSWFWVCLGLCLAFGLPELHLGRLLTPEESLRAVAIREAVFWLIGLTIILFAVERRPLASIGLRSPGWRTVVYVLLAAIVMMASVVLIYSVLFPLLNHPAPALVSDSYLPARRGGGGSHLPRVSD